MSDLTYKLAKTIPDHVDNLNDFSRLIDKKEKRIATLELERKQRPRELPYQLLYKEAKEQNIILKARVKELEKDLDAALIWIREGKHKQEELEGKLAEAMTEISELESYVHPPNPFIKKCKKQG